MKRCLNCMEEYEEQNAICPLCGWDGSWKKGEWLEPGSILQGRYIIGTARTRNPADMLYIGWDALFSRKVLIEEYFPQSCVYRDSGSSSLKQLGEKAADRKAGRDRFIAAGQALIAMDGTRGLLEVLSVAEENETVYMVMEYAGERTLRDVLSEEAPWTLAQTERLLMDLSGTLMAAHRSSVYHGQLGLDCCYVAQETGYKLGRFNDAGFLTGDLAEAGAGAPGPGVDIFELAHIAGAALAGVAKWENRDVDESLDELAETVPEYVVDTLSDALSSDPSRRPESLRRFLDRFMDEATIEMPSNRVLPEAELPAKPTSIWKKIFN